MGIKCAYSQSREERTMERVGVYLSEIQVKKLEAIRKKTGLSIAEHIRRALDKYLEECEKKERERK